MSLVETFSVIDYGAATIRTDLISGMVVIGGRFDVYATFRRDPANAYRRLEYRQYIRGEMAIVGDPALTRRIEIRLPIPRGGTRLIDKDIYYEDGDPLTGNFYGHRTNAVADEDYYYTRDPATQAENKDMLGGDHYLNFDIYGIRLRPAQLLLLRNKPIHLNLQFKVQIVECNQAGGEPVGFNSNAFTVFSKTLDTTIH